MGKRLSASQVAEYRDTGILFPIRVAEAAEAGRLFGCYQAIADRHGGRIPARHNQKGHLLYPWVAELIRSPTLLDPVEDLLGPNLFCWGTQFFAKGVADSSFVSWHQDATYWGLSAPDVVTAWIALTPSNRESGCMRVIPGTHKRQVEHTDTFAQNNLLSRGQEITVQVDPSRAVDVELEPGEMSLHHVLLFHGSEANRAALPRVGFAIRYIPTHIRQLSGLRDSATLVRGVDTYHHFDHERTPRAELDDDALEHHKEVLDRQLKILYSGSRQAGRLGASIDGTPTP